MTVAIDVDGWTIDGEDALLAWLANEAVLEGEDGLEVQFVLVDDATITELNEQYLDHEGPTDVITFDLRDDDDDVPFVEGDAPLEGGGEGGNESSPSFPEGEVYVSLETAREQAKEYACSITDELSRLMLHGLLHLAGWDDGTRDQRQAMAEREDQGLARAGRESGALPWRLTEPGEQRG